MTDPKARADPSESKAELLVQEIGEEYLDRLQRGETPDPRALVAAHPEVAELLEQQLNLVEILYRARLFPDFLSENSGHHMGTDPHSGTNGLSARNDPDPGADS